MSNFIVNIAYYTVGLMHGKEVNVSIHIIDDEIMLAELISELLELNGYDASRFYSSESYLMHIHSDGYVEPKIILTDLMMPGMDGFGLIKEIRKTNSTAKIIAMSGFHDHLMMAADVDATLTKPFEFELLLTTVRQFHPAYSLSA